MSPLSCMAGCRTSRKLLLAVLLTALACSAQTRTALAAQPTSAVTLQQVRLRTSDGVHLDGIVYRPTHPRPVALFLVHGYGGNFYGGYFPALGLAAGERGYTVLALNMRDHDTGPKISDFADNHADIAAGVEYLHSLGLERLVLLGQSMGTNRVLFYQASAADPGIAATVLVSGPGSLFQWNVWQFGREKAQASVDEALRMQAAGQERQFMLIDMGPLGKALYTPRYLLSLRGPKALSDPYHNIQKVKNPILIVQGKADKLIEPDIAGRLKKAATASPKLEVIYVEGADHGFSSQESALAGRVLGWLETVVR